MTITELLDALATCIGCGDYSTKRIPSQDAIRQLCGSFLAIDFSSADTTQSPIVKLSHKSVQDFFLLRHDLIPPDHLSKYFVDRSSAHREMGRTCLTYLRFRRYESPDGLPESFETDPEHAFLPYASVFWFQHLDMRGVAREEMRQEIRDFLQSCAFWTAFRVQTRVTPYLFARYVQRGSCGYSMRANGSDWTNQTSSLRPYHFGGISRVMGHCQKMIWKSFTISNASSWSGTRHSRLTRMLCCYALWTLQLRFFSGQSKVLGQDNQASHPWPTCAGTKQ